MKEQQTYPLIFFSIMILLALTISSCATTDHQCAAFASSEIK